MTSGWASTSDTRNFTSDSCIRVEWIGVLRARKGRAAPRDTRIHRSFADFFAFVFPLAFERRRFVCSDFVR